MGNIIPLDASKKQAIEDLASEFLATFALEYPLAYGVQLAKVKLKEIDKETYGEEEKKKELTYRKEIKLTEPRKIGYLIKQGAVIKNWKKRFFVVNPDYVVDYFENEEGYQKGFKAKGHIVPAGYKVEEDADGAIMQRLKKIAKAMGVDESELPQPDKYPEYTFEVAHERRRSYYITAENEEEKKEWIDMFEKCCLKAEGFKNSDPVGKEAFKIAHKKARGESGMWPTSRSGGTEEQVLSDSIVELINWRVMGSVYSSLSGNYMIRKKVREQVVKMLDSMVLAMVIPSYKALVESTQKMKGPMEESINNKKDEIINIQKKLTTEMSEKFEEMISVGVQDVIEDIKKMGAVIKQQVTKALAPMREQCVVGMLDKISNQAKENDLIEDSLEKYFKKLDYVKASGSVSDYIQAYNIMSELPGLLEKYEESVGSMPYYMWPCYTALDMMVEVVDGAFFTFEELFKDLIKGTDALTNGKTAADAMVTSKDQVLPKYDADIKDVPEEISLFFTKTAVILSVRSKIDPNTKTLRRTLRETIPKPVEQIVDVEDRYDMYIDECVGNLIKKTFGIADTPSKTEEEKPPNKSGGEEKTDEANSEGPASEKPSTDL